MSTLSHIAHLAELQEILTKLQNASHDQDQWALYCLSITQCI